MSSNVRERKPGRPRAIPEKLVPHVISLYRQRFGYRAIRRELRKEGISVSWSTVRRLVKEKLDKNLNYRLKICRYRFKVKLHKTPHYELEYFRRVAKIERHKNPRYQPLDYHITIPERPKTNLSYHKTIHPCDSKVSTGK